MAFNVAEFRANMVGDGARPNLFSVSLVYPLIAGPRETPQDCKHACTRLK